MNLRNKKILVTGASGFLGSHVVEELKKNGVLAKNLLLPSSKKYDLRKESIAKKLTKGMDIVIHLAGNVGGINKNLQYPGTMFYDNILMGIHIIHAAMLSKVEKIVVIGTICSYPKYTSVPFKEASLWEGYPEETNAAYGLAKKMLLVQSTAYRKQYGLNSILLLPVNMYGPRDSFDLEASHVIPALIKKFYIAMREKKGTVTLWGDGNPTREFLHVKDAARAIVLATQKYEKADPVNIGTGKEISIKSLAMLIAKIMKYKEKIVWDTTKPNGQPRRMLDVSKAKKEFGFSAKIPLENGLKETISWYQKNTQ